MLPHASFLHDAGYSLLIFDFRSRGESEGGAVTMGSHHERDDVNGAVKFLNGREDVDAIYAAAIAYQEGLWFIPNTGHAECAEIAPKEHTIRVVAFSANTENHRHSTLRSNPAHHVPPASNLRVIKPRHILMFIYIHKELYSRWLTVPRSEAFWIASINLCLTTAVSKSGSNRFPVRIASPNRRYI
jgi:hypothetical protein